MALSSVLPVAALVAMSHLAHFARSDSIAGASTDAGLTTTEIPEDELMDVTEHNLMMGRTCTVQACYDACRRANHAAARCNAGSCQCRDRKPKRHFRMGGDRTVSEDNINVNYNVNNMFPAAAPQMGNMGAMGAYMQGPYYPPPQQPWNYAQSPYMAPPGAYGGYPPQPLAYPPQPLSPVGYPPRVAYPPQQPSSPGAYLPPQPPPFGNYALPPANGSQSDFANALPYPVFQPLGAAPLGSFASLAPPAAPAPPPPPAPPAPPAPPLPLPSQTMQSGSPAATEPTRQSEGEGQDGGTVSERHPQLVVHTSTGVPALRKPMTMGRPEHIAHNPHLGHVSQTGSNPLPPWQFRVGQQIQLSQTS